MPDRMPVGGDQGVLRGHAAKDATRLPPHSHLGGDVISAASRARAGAAPHSALASQGVSGDLRNNDGFFGSGGPSGPKCPKTAACFSRLWHSLSHWMGLTSCSQPKPQQPKILSLQKLLQSN